MKNGSLHYLIASRPCAFHFSMFSYVMEATTVTCISICYIVCVFAVKTLRFTDFFPLPPHMLYEEIVHSNDTVRDTSG